MPGSLLRRWKQHDGFTLIELLIVILLIAILLLMASSTFLGQQNKGYDAGAKGYLAVTYREGKTLYTSSGGVYPVVNIGLQTPAQWMSTQMQASEPQFAYHDAAAGVDVNDSKVIQTDVIADNSVVYSNTSQSRKVFCVQIIEHGTRHGYGPGIYWSWGYGTNACGAVGGGDGGSIGGQEPNGTLHTTPHPLPDPPVIGGNPAPGP